MNPYMGQQVSYPYAAQPMSYPYMQQTDQRFFFGGFGRPFFGGPFFGGPFFGGPFFGGFGLGFPFFF